MASKKRGNAAIEWVTGFISVPGYVTGEGEPYRPEVLVWIDENGLVIGMDTARPGLLIHRIAAHFRQTTLQPIIGPARRPTRVRVASPEIAATLRAALGDTLDVVCAPTPEVDAIFAAMVQRMNVESAIETYLTPEISEGAMAAFFSAAADLFRVKPWSIVPSDQSLLSITVEELGVRDAVISTVGQAGESLGVLFFSDIAAFDAYLEVAAAMEHGEQPDLTPHFSINFDTCAGLAAAALEEIEEYGWEVAGPSAYPSMIVVDEGVVRSAPTADQLTLGEVIALALAEVLSEKTELLRAWQGEKAFSRTLTVTTHAGAFDVTVAVLHEEEAIAGGESVPVDLMKAFAELPSDGDEIDSEARETLEDALLERFAESPEAEPLDVIDTCSIVMGYAADYFGETIATMTPADLREIVFEILPRKLATEASAAGPIVAELRAFFTFLKREFGLTQADKLLAVLGGDATARLTRAFSDPRNFGMAKSIMMRGVAAGFDIGSREGAEAWMREVQGKPLSPSIELPEIPRPPPRAVDPAAERARKNKRKAEKKARKKNR